MMIVPLFVNRSVGLALTLLAAVVSLSTVSDAFSPPQLQKPKPSSSVWVSTSRSLSSSSSSSLTLTPSSGRHQHFLLSTPPPYVSRSIRSAYSRLSSSSLNSSTDESSSANKNNKKKWRIIPPLFGASPPSADVKSLLSATWLILLDVAFRKIFRHYAIPFPSSLAGCGVLLATLLVAPTSLASRLYDALSPGARLLAKWLSVFFVPSLITLPLLSDGAGSAIELFKVGLVVVGGFYFSLLSTAWSVVTVRKFVGQKKNQPKITSEKKEEETDSINTSNDAIKSITTTDNNATPPAAPATPPPPPTPAAPPPAFSNQLHNRLLFGSLASGGATLLASKMSLLRFLEPSVTSLFFLSTTLYTFVVGARLPKKVTKLVHPLVTCTALTWAVAYGLATLTGRSWKMMLASYRHGGGGGAGTGSAGTVPSAAIASLLHPSIGAGDALLFLLGPAVLSLACQMYERRTLVQSNAAAVTAGVAMGSLGGLFGTAAAVRLLQIGNPYMRLSLLSRNITSPLAMAMASMLGANVSLAVALVVVTGLLGANFGSAILNMHGIVDDDIARGMAMGAASHGLGTAAMVNEPLAFPFAAISMALTASVGTVLVSIPLVQRLLLQLTLGW